MYTFKKVILIVYMLVSIQVKAQNNAIKIYTNFNITIDKLYNQTNTTSSFGRFSPSFSKNTRNGNFHELELSSFIINRYKYETDSSSNIQLINGGRYNLQNIGLKYEFSFRLLKNSTSRLQPYIGTSANVTFLRYANIPILSTVYYHSSISISTSFFITPRLIYNINDNCFFDLNIPFNITRIGLERYKYLNPTIPIENQIYYSQRFELFPKQFEFKFGFGYRFN